ncbi:MAG: hypothetical protein NEHIOOID_00241 [Holosporales bacterium]
MDYIFEIMIVAGLIVLNGFLALCELAVISCNRTKIETQSGHKKSGKILLQLIDDPGFFLSTIQVGITIIGIISGAFSGQNFAEPLGLYLDQVPFLKGHGLMLGYGIVVMIMTYFSIVLGELAPKRIAIHQPEKIAIIIAIPIHILSKIIHPFVVVLNKTTDLALTCVGVDTSKEIPTLTEEEILSFVKRGYAEGALDDFEHKTFQKILQFGNREACVIMTPRLKVVYLDVCDPYKKNVEKILSHPHRYYPVFENGLDHFKGIFDAKDALNLLLQGQNLQIEKLIKNVPCVVEDNLGPDLLEQFKKFKTHIAVVIDEYGQMQGLVTLVDILETLVGTIPEFKSQRHYSLTKKDENTWLCDGLTPIDEIEDLLDCSFLRTDNDYNTLAGFLLNQCRYIPQVGELIKWKTYAFEIIEMDENRIDKVMIKKEHR